MGGKRVTRDCWTFADLVERCKGKPDTEVAALQATYNEMHNIDPTNYYPPEIADRRFKTVLRAALRVPPADAEEAALRNQIRKDWGLPEETTAPQQNDDRALGLPSPAGALPETANSTPTE